MVNYRYKLDSVLIHESKTFTSVSSFLLRRHYLQPTAPIHSSISHSYDKETQYLKKTQLINIHQLTKDKNPHQMWGGKGNLFKVCGESPMNVGRTG